MKTGIALPVALAMIFLLLAGAVASAGAPTDTVRKMLDDVLAVQSDPALQGDASRAERRAAIKKLILENFAFDEMARQALGQHWNRLDAPRRAEFRSVFQDLFLDSYSRLVLDFLKKEKIAYIGEDDAQQRATVKTRIQRINEEIPVDYLLVQSGGRMKVADVSIDGVSIVGNYQKSFSRVIGQESYESLLKKMKLQRQAAQKG